MDPVNPEQINQTITQAGPVFDFVQTVFIVLGVIILLIVVFRVAKQFAKGDMAGVAKTAIGGLVAALLCFNLTLPIKMISSAGNLAESVFTSLGNLAGGNSDGSQNQ